MINYLRYLTILGFVILSGAADVTENTIDRGTISLGLGQTHIYPGVYWSIINNAVSSFTGSFNNEGGFYVSSDNPLLGLTTNINAPLQLFRTRVFGLSIHPSL